MQLDLAEARQERLKGIADRAAGRTRRLWRARMGPEFDAGWAGIAADTIATVTAGQVAAAAGASTYLAATARADDRTVDPERVQADAFTGVDASGRDLEGLLYGAVTAAKLAVGAGLGLQGALTAGGAYLTVMSRTAVMDTGRSADLTAASAQGYTHYVRVVSPGACSRCAILAGKSSGKTAFRRHPGCRCTAAPDTDDEVTGRYASPTDYFESLSAAEQERVFTRAGAGAIRAGADPISVVSARRGATRGYAHDNETLIRRARLQKTIIGRASDGSPILGYTTAEGTTARGAFGRRNRIATDGGRTKRIRLMPETITALTDDIELRRVLLRDAGYLDYPTNAAERSAPLGGGYPARRDAAIRADRATADAFYRRHGIQLGA